MCIIGANKMMMTMMMMMTNFNSVYQIFILQQFKNNSQRAAVSSTEAIKCQRKGAASFPCPRRQFHFTVVYSQIRAATV